ncbi:MAG: hypothetical protein A2293_17045 [Elusimicrobia bacterium RIFOXYB2_FULL_49_7]|nr:MAG: hypothetical protein A2293_17045 [Elusimicrobia bacterium RIFOXYB2_FULL_49_7]
MKALILIGGLGTRLRPLTCNTPKPLLPIANRPFVEYQLQLLKKHGIREVVLCVAYLSHEFENYLGNGKRWGMKIHYVHEKEPLGTGGAIRNAARFIDQPIIIFNGDILTDINLHAMCSFHKKNKAIATIALTRVKDPTMFGLVETARDGKIERFLEKPSWDEVTCNTINAGIYVFDPGVLSYIPEGVNYSVERGLFPSLLTKQFPLYGYASNCYWMDIGTIEKYMQAHFDIISGHLSFPLAGKHKIHDIYPGKHLKVGKDVTINGRMVCGDNTRISNFVQISGNVCLGHNVTIGKGSSLTDSIVLDNSHIGEGVRLEKAIVGKKCVIEANASLDPYTVLGHETIIRKYSRL